MGSLYVSASEIELFDLCPRKWAFVYIENKRPPPNESAALGTRVHKILENWLKHGTAPDTWTQEGEIAASGLHLLPPPRTPGLVTEEAFHFTSRRAWYTGFKDFRYRDANGLLHVGDHKTTKAFTWAKSTEEILCHPQALIYGVDEFRKNPNDNYLALDWIYYRTAGSKKAEPRFQIVTREQVAEMFFEHVDPVAGEITSLHNSTPRDASALDFRPDFRSCEAYGGCAFLSICNPTPTQKVQAIMTQVGPTLAERLKAMQGTRPPSLVHPPEFTAPAQAAPPQVQLPVPGLAAAPAAPAQTLPIPAAPAAPPAPGGVWEVPVPPAPSPGPVAAPVAPAAPAPGPVAAPVAPEASKAKRGRPKGSTSASSNGHGFTLYVGCAPIGSEVTSALDYVNAAHDQLKEAYHVTHYREMEFGKGPGELCKSLEALLVMCETAGNAPTGDIVYGNTQIEQDVASVWFSKAAKIVRAFR